jgi:hypothetical protein
MRFGMPEELPASRRSRAARSSSARSVVEAAMGGSPSGPIVAAVRAPSRRPIVTAI